MSQFLMEFWEQIHFWILYCIRVSIPALHTPDDRFRTLPDFPYRPRICNLLMEYIHVRSRI